MKQESVVKIDTQLVQTMAKMLVANMQMVEIYIPSRTTQVAREMGLWAGWNLDLTIHDVDGKVWDFNSIEMRNRAIRKIFIDESLLLIGNPMCTIYNIMKHANHARMDPDEVAERSRYVRKHLEFSTQLYKIPVDAGRYFYREYPQGASPWEEICIKEFMKRQGMMRVVGDQCMYRFKSRDGQREGPARKRTGFLTNAICIA